MGKIQIWKNCLKKWNVGRQKFVNVNFEFSLYDSPLQKILQYRLPHPQRFLLPSILQGTYCCRRTHAPQQISTQNHRQQLQQNHPRWYPRTQLNQQFLSQWRSPSHFRKTHAKNQTNWRLLLQGNKVFNMCVHVQRIKARHRDYFKWHLC